MFIGILLIIDKKYKHPKCSSVDNQNAIYSYKELIFGHQKEWIPQCRWKHEEREARSKRPHMMWFHLHEMSTVEKSVEIETVAKVREEWDVTTIVSGSMPWGDENVLELDGDDGWTTSCVC